MQFSDYNLDAMTKLIALQGEAAAGAHKVEDWDTMIAFCEILTRMAATLCATTIINQTAACDGDEQLARAIVAAHLSKLIGVALKSSSQTTAVMSDGTREKVDPLTFMPTKGNA